MTALDAAADGTPLPRAHAEEAAAAQAVAAGPLAGDPAMLGLPSFIVGSVALGLVVGVVPPGAVGASLPVILAATSAGLFVATIWSAAVGQSAVASVFGIFAGFWLSYAVLVLGLTHNWFGITAAAVTDTQKLFLIAWLIVIVMLTLATLRLPMAFTAVFVLIDIALLLVLLGTAQASTGLLKTGGYFVLAFAALGMYLFFSSASQATGGNALPLGRPVLRG
jgi:succinate-acetate transporter protein